MVATLRQIVRVEAGGIVRIQSDQLLEGSVAQVLITTDSVEKLLGSTWETFIGAGMVTGRSVEQIDASMRELRDEWQQ